MADDDREPPPLFDDDDDSKKDSPEPDDLFSSANSTVPTKKDSSDSEDLFKDEKHTEISLDDEESKADSNEKEPSLLFDEEEPPKMGISSASTKSAASSISKSSRSREEIDEEESGDKFNIDISVTDPSKVGDGMGAYMSYKVITKTNIPTFRSSELIVMRRFSDFLGLHEKLVEKYLAEGKIIPPAPEKSVIGMTKVKMSKDETGSFDFVERRRNALERYLNRTAAHPVLQNDTDFRDFLEADGELPKATSTSALSGAGVMRLFSKVGDAVGKMAFKMDETDQWFEEKHQQIENLDQQLKKLHSSVEALVNHRKDLGMCTASFAKSCAMLANSEEHTALSRALSQLAEVEEKIDQVHEQQAEMDFFILAELLKDYVALIGAVKEAFNERVKCYKFWKDAEAMLTKKREAKVKLELAHKMDKIPMAAQEITEWEQKVEKGQVDFEKISQTIRKEMSRFEKQRVQDFKTSVVKALESLMETQQQLIKYWEAFLPEAKAIA
ncbi:sorting nexin-2-like [Tubulanus polymorphus]|uniref:sorting nexin-2-like n=1 Tax=Tubulanus polymorphus TaxID=672921 RepID=UPI003DA43A46